ncbi:ubiquitin carboxyl-terminal hydrolase [Vespula squamosa]|uniref:Ubiquitin carboxyl-terminal hydrolase n=1 Tax=Vespula squamosa TaxID=30214 RepID=A0ABD2B9N4_VESSQ
MAWIPLESNPEVMTKFLHKLGVPEQWNMIDIYGLEPDLLAVVPRPVLAVILLYPESVKTEVQNKEDEETKSKDNGKDRPDGVYHMKQIISNACGTVALIHSVANNMEEINLKEGFLKSFLDDSKDLSFAERGELLDILILNLMLVQAPEEDTPVYYHFVAFVQKNGTLYELDGRKLAPVDHGPTTRETLLEDSVRVCKEYMARDPSEMRFTVVALAASY